MTEYSDIIFEKRGAAAWIHLNRPRDLNSLSRKMLDEIPAALATARADGAVKAVVFTGAGPAFCAGADLKFVQAMPAGERDAASAAFIARATEMMNLIEAFPKPVIAAVNGIATAGGMELVLVCDIVFAARNAKMGDGHANFGLLPGAGGSARLPRKIGLNRANYLFFTGELIPADEFVAAGLVNRAVPGEDLEKTVWDFVEHIAAKSPLGLARMKAMARQSLDLPLGAAVANEQIVSQLHSYSFDRQEGIAAFVEKRKPVFRGI